MLLNPDKSEALFVGTRAQKAKINSTCLSVDGAVVPFRKSIKCLGVTIDSEVTMNAHITEIVKSCNYHLKALRHIRPVLGREPAETIARSIILSKLDYFNSVLSGCSDLAIDRLQKVQNSLARVVTGSNWREHITPVLIDLHWLPVKYRINYKLAVLTYSTHLSKVPNYLSELLTEYVPARTLRSCVDPKLVVPRTTSALATRAFSVSAPTVWNSLPTSLRNSDSLSAFKSGLKTFYFNLAYNT